MKILIVHNAYQQRGGEDVVVEDEVALLRAHGHQIEMFTRHNDTLTESSKLYVAANTFWSHRTAKNFQIALTRFAPDVVHVHNTFPQISPAVHWVAHRSNTPTVQTLHNFRLHCPQAMYLRHGHVCEDCLDKNPWRGAMRGCYRQSISQSTVLAGMLTLHRVLGTWENKVTRFIALSQFSRDKLIQGGLPADRIVVKPNFVDLPPQLDRPRKGFLSVGRLSVEKGIDVLVKTVTQNPQLAVRIAGSGPQNTLVHQVPGITALGPVSPEVVWAEMTRATALVLPSICYENFPRTLVEAFACGLPVIASRIGSLAELVDDGETGLLFSAGDSDDLSQKMCWAEQNPTEMARMGRNARAKYDAEFTADTNYQQLMSIYQDAIAFVQQNHGS